MFKHIRTFAALTLLLAFVLSASAALAAPRLSLSLPKKPVNSGSNYTITLSATEPGFATVKLLQNGSLVATLFDSREIHTEKNELSLKAVNASGENLAAGAYTVSAVMVDQFGNFSAEVTEMITFDPPQTPVTAPVIAQSGSASAPAPSASSSSSSSSSSAPKTTPLPASSVLSYTPGVCAMGEEGFEIGVGVSDSDATAKGAWAITADSTDEEIWAALQTPMTSVDVAESENAYIYDSTEEGRKRLGTLSGLSQGLNVVAKLDNGWSLVEAYRIEDGAFVRGYIRTKTLREVIPNKNYGLVIDKNTQTLTVYKDGARVGSCLVSTGLPTVKYPHRETPAGEFITVTRRGTIEYYGNGFTKCTIRINGSFHLSEIPSTKKNGTDFSMLESSLGQKATRGNICIAHAASTDGGINAQWIWNMTDESKRVKVIIVDDKERSSVPVTE